MKSVRDLVTLLLCAYGGGCLASFALALGAMSFYRDFDSQIALLDHAYPAVGWIGAAAGAVLFLRGRRRNPKVKSVK